MNTTAEQTPTTTACAPADSLTKSLLGYGIIAGPIYVTVSLAQALTREGFDLSGTPGASSATATGWLQITNFVVVGLMTVVPIGLGRALPGGLGATWAGRLLAAYGVSLIAAGAFRADPGAGFRSDRPPSRSSPGTGCCTSSPAASDSWPSSGPAWWWRAGTPWRSARWALFSWIGVWLLVAFIGVAAGAGRSATVLAFVTAVILAWTWPSAVAVDRYRRVGRS